MKAVKAPSEPFGNPPPDPPVRSSNLYVRSTQLDEATCQALDAWQTKHGIRSSSSAMRLLLQEALSADGTLDVEKRVQVARAGTLRAARVAVLDALDAL